MKSFTLFAIVLVILGIFTSQNDAMCPCPRIMDPVCGSDHQTYQNECILNCEAKSSHGRSLGLRMVSHGSCDTFNEDPIY